MLRITGVAGLISHLAEKMGGHREEDYSSVTHMDLAGIIADGL